MTNMNALGYFMDYCNRNAHDSAVSKHFLQGLAEIRNSPEGRFSNCVDINGVLSELNYDGLTSNGAHQN